MFLLLPLFRNDRKACTFRFCNFRKCHFTFSNCYVVELDNYFFHGYQPSFLFYFLHKNSTLYGCKRCFWLRCYVVVLRILWRNYVTFFLISLEVLLFEPRLLVFRRLPFRILNLVSIPLFRLVGHGDIRRFGLGCLF